MSSGHFEITLCPTVYSDIYCSTFELITHGPAKPFLCPVFLLNLSYLRAYRLFLIKSPLRFAFQQPILLLITLHSQIFDLQLFCVLHFHRLSPSPSFSINTLLLTPTLLTFFSLQTFLDIFGPNKSTFWLSSGKNMKPFCSSFLTEFRIKRNVLSLK
ncbi:hypothetical protein CDAR_564961 [Caerostris darwini]|uniref:Uncharacterized protein n=1 Tax=Caerostris darwini TaxID=1538125 RepID=A0AAV4USN9_9ARAC|nr:hypothetical protein CDAR_517771 [Caerostris darwini]GIY60405.1 hypothetical protein CDAR_564961 [Caerostris darwini]